LGNVLFFVGEWATARRHLEQGLAVYQPLRYCSHSLHNTIRFEVFGLSRLAPVLWVLGYPDQALRRSQESLSLARDLSHPVSVATALVFAADLHCRRREGQKAYEQAEAACVLAGEQGVGFPLAPGTDPTREKA